MMNETNELELATKATYQKWYNHCHEVLAHDQQYRYEHPSEEIRLKMMRVPSLHEAGGEQDPAPSIAVTLELFWNDPLLGVHLGMWTRNPAAMAMLFAGLELMEADVDVNSGRNEMTYINNVASPGELARLDYQAGLVGAVTKRLPAALEHADFTTILDIGCGSGRWTLINRSELSKSRNVRVCCAIRDMSL